MGGSALSFHSSVIWVSNSALPWYPKPSVTCRKEVASLCTKPTSTTALPVLPTGHQRTGARWPEVTLQASTQKIKPRPCLSHLPQSARGLRPTTKIVPSWELSLHTSLVTAESLRAHSPETQGVKAIIIKAITKLGECLRNYEDL